MTPDEGMPASAAGNEPPARLEVRYDPAAQTLRAGAVAAVAVLCAMIPFASETRTEQTWLLSGALFAGALAWAAAAALRIRDRSPQVVIDRDGVWVREWMIGTVPWDNIDQIAHSSSVRRSIVSSVTRTRRRPYLLFRFVERPQIRPTARPPLSWLQAMRAESELQEPCIQQRGLDTPVETMIASIQAHIAHWQAETGQEITPL